MFHWNVDTWYYSPGDPIGEIALGVAPLKGVAAFTRGQLSAFCQACSGLFRPHGSVQIFHKESLDDLHTPVDAVPVAGSDQLLAAVSTWLESSSHWIIGLAVPCDVWVAMRAEDGTISDQWLERVGRLSMGAQHKDAVASSDGQTLVAPWDAHLICRVASLFQKDNRAVLTHARELWKLLLEQDSASTQFPEHYDESPILTLAVPPPGTPPDNEELYERNAPRLREAISRWEQATDHRFQWAVSLED